MRVIIDENWTLRNRVRPVSLDWEAVGRLVRRRTLEAVSRHFAELGASSTAVCVETVGDAPTCEGGA